LPDAGLRLRIILQVGLERRPIIPLQRLRSGVDVAGRLCLAGSDALDLGVGGLVLRAGIEEIED
jgi:hypothetical protein